MATAAAAAAPTPPAAPAASGAPASAASAAAFAVGATLPAVARAACGGGGGGDAPLTRVVLAIGDAVADVSRALRTVDFDHQQAAGSTNSFGDDQLHADVHTDELIFARLRACGSVASASSEETSEVVPLNGSSSSSSPNPPNPAAAAAEGGSSSSSSSSYTVAFDPLDGSSIIGANFAVGSIFGVWPGATPIGQRGRDQAAAAYAVYGPRTLLVVALPLAAAGNSGSGGAKAAAAAGGEAAAAAPAGDEQQQQQQCASGGPAATHTVFEFMLTESGAPAAAAAGAGWRLRAVHNRIGSRNNVAPANIRAAAGNAPYADLIQRWIAGGCKLRYSGGLVPDVHHLLAKGGGVFCNPSSPAAPAKLRLLYECAPMAFVVEAAGGASHDGRGSVLDAVIRETNARSIVALGSAPQVAACLDAMRASVPEEEGGV